MITFAVYFIGLALLAWLSYSRGRRDGREKFIADTRAQLRGILDDLDARAAAEQRGE